MSRHRNVRNLVEDDYYDGYDDDDYYDDDYYEEEESYAPPPKPAAAPTPAKTFTAQLVPKPKAAPAPSNVGVTKAPPGWGKPSSTTTTTTTTTKASTTGVMAAPPGWEKPSSPSAPPTGIAKPPAGWGKPSAPGNAKDAPSRNTAGKSAAKSRSKSPKRGGSAEAGSTAKYIPKAVPSFVKDQKSQLSMVILGHVDAGKSTLMGQILVQTNQISKRDAAKQENLSWLLDENESERARGVTMEIGTKTLRVPKHDIVVLDAPGHHDFIPVMITGAANADVAILVIAAVTGEFEAGFTGGGQTKEHIMLARGLGVTQIIVAVNKLDVEGWKQDRYESIQSQVKDFLLQQEFKPKRMQFVPISGLAGENVKTRTSPQLSQWYKGPTLLEAVNNFFPANRQVEKPPRFIVTDVFAEGKGIVTRGRVIQGFVEVGDSLVVLPVGDIVKVSKLEHLQPPSDGADDPRRLAVGMAGDTVQLLVTDTDIMRLSIGNILCFPSARPPLTRKANARIIVMEDLAVPIIRGAQVIFHMHSLDVPTVLTKLHAILKRDGSVKKERPRALTKGVSARVELTVSDRIVMEPFSKCRSLGRFVLRRGGETIAIGVIDETL
mmetsp:Transcript_6325/g.18025  ORF Transcript_6325/g.18025 Transcript_6325/m.18025 type:complete len:605 (+) Transcript_6325:305-2119(+)